MQVLVGKVHVYCALGLILFMIFFAWCEQLLTKLNLSLISPQTFLRRHDINKIDCNLFDPSSSSYIIF